MEKKICPICNFETPDELEVCPKCGAMLKAEEETLKINEELNPVLQDGVSQEDQEPGETEENPFTEDETAVKSGKLVRFFAVFLALIVLFFGGKFLWSNFGPGSVISVVTFDTEDVVGTYSDSVYGRYYTFKSDVKELETKKSDSSDSDEQLSFDGTYESGFTKEYINSTS